MTSKLTRRTMLAGTGALIGLPLLEPMLRGDVAAQLEGAKRWGVFYFPMGCHDREWAVGNGADGTPAIPDFLASSLGRVKSELTWVSGLGNRQSGEGDHETAAGCFLSCSSMVLPGPTFDRSADQIVAAQLGAELRIPSLTLSAPGLQTAADCCRHVEVGLNHISWQGGSTATTKLQRPREVWDRLFPPDLTAEGLRAAELRQRRRGSILDFARRDATRLEASLVGRDRERLQAYLENVREVERRLTLAGGAELACGPGEAPPAEVDFEQHTALMHDLAFLAFQCGATPVISYIMDFEFSDRRVSIDGVTSGHHSVSHHESDDVKIAQFRRIQAYYAEHFATLVERMRAARDVDGRSLLESSVLMLCSGMSDGNSHDRGEIPMVIAGTAGGRITPNRSIAVEQPLAALFRTTMRLMGASGEAVDRFGGGGPDLDALVG